jgi:biotin transport system substrate-specific component
MRTSALAEPRSAALTAAAVVGFAAAIAAASQVAIPLPGTPVPLTLQPMLVVLAGLWLGPRAGAASMLLFLAAGAAGLPVFSPMGPPGLLRLAGPTGGYLLAYPVAAFVAGSLAARATGFGGRLLASSLGFLALFVGGVLQLALLTGSLERAVTVGFLPFVVPDAAKAVLAAVLAPARRRAARR